MSEYENLENNVEAGAEAIAATETAHPAVFTEHQVVRFAAVITNLTAISTWTTPKTLVGIEATLEYDYEYGDGKTKTFHPRIQVPVQQGSDWKLGDQLIVSVERGGF